jgi:hypothetical protein
MLDFSVLPILDPPSKPVKVAQGNPGLRCVPQRLRDCQATGFKF